MSDRREVVRELGLVLAKLELLSEGRTAKLDGDRVKGSKEHAPPSQSQSTFHFHLGRVRAVLLNAQEAVERERKQSRDGMNPQEWRFWFFDTYEGKHYRDVAEWEGMKPMQVYMMRERAGRDGQTGNLRAERVA